MQVIETPLFLIKYEKSIIMAIFWYVEYAVGSFFRVCSITAKNMIDLKIFEMEGHGFDKWPRALMSTTEKTNIVHKEN